MKIKRLHRRFCELLPGYKIIRCTMNGLFSHNHLILQLCHHHFIDTYMFSSLNFIKIIKMNISKIDKKRSILIKVKLIKFNGKFKVKY